MLHDTIKKLIEILKTEDIDEIEVRRFWTTVRVARRPRSSGSMMTEPVSISQAETRPETAREETGPAAPEGLDQITSPMVGTFYCSPSPEADPFVYEGKRVERGEIICIIEAMKLMNEIEAEQSGIIRKVLVTDSEPVEFGQPLFLVESA